jgi:hypothetical protein
MAQFEPGRSGNPKGRQKGSRNRLGEEFLAALYADFQANGPAAIVRVREEKPDAYLKVIASLLPREIRIEEPSDMTDEELDQRIRDLSDALGLAATGRDVTH